MKMSIKSSKACISDRYVFDSAMKAETRKFFKKMGNRFNRRVVDKNVIREALAA